MNPEEEAALLAAIRERPDDDLPRLVYADWLDEHAREEECDRCDGTGLSATPNGDFARKWPCDKCNFTGRVSNGYAERAEFIRMQCYGNSADVMRVHRLLCDQHKNPWFPETLKLLRLESDDWGIRPDILAVEFDDKDIEDSFVVRRGLIDEFRGPLQSCLDHLPALVRHPAACVTRVRVTDREPYMGMDGRVRQWRWHDSATPSGLPSNLFDLLERHSSDIRKLVTMKTYPSRELAESALSDALLKMAWEETK